MMADVLRSGFPGVRLGRAFVLSLAWHAALLFLPLPRVTHAPAAALTARLLPLPDEASPLESSRTTEVAEPAVPPAPTVHKDVHTPRPLTGQALQSALGKLSQDMVYPREAIERGMEGKVILLLALDEGGAVRSVDIAASSGHAVLDAAALTAAARIRQIPGGRRQVLLPVEFRLE